MNNPSLAQLGNSRSKQHN